MKPRVAERPNLSQRARRSLALQSQKRKSLLQRSQQPRRLLLSQLSQQQAPRVPLSLVQSQPLSLALSLVQSQRSLKPSQLRLV